MFRISAQTILAATLLLSGAAVSTAAAPPAPPAGPFTFWNKLGIPQGYQKMKDANINKRGNHPNWERKPKLKRIADPANLESPNPAIKKAAEVKSEEDLAPQKIKGIKYLASIGCGCYNKDGGITNALLAAMDDCTEEVRLAAVEAISDAGQCEACVNCKQKTCCTQAIAKQLEKMAYEQDDKGCWFEPSERIRAAAARAANVCSVKVEPKVIDEDKELEIHELPKETPRRESPTEETPPAPDSARRKSPNLAAKGWPSDTVKPVSKSSRSSSPMSAANTRSIFDPIPTPREIPQSAPVKSDKQPGTMRTSSGKQPAAPIEQDIWISDAEPSAVHMNFKAPALDRHSTSAPASAARISVVKLAESPAAEMPDGPALAMATSGMRAPAAPGRPQSGQRPKMAAKPTGMSASRSAPIAGNIAQIDRAGGGTRIRLNTKTVVPTGTRFNVNREYLLGTTTIGQLEVTSSEPGFVTAQPVGELNAARLSTTDTVTLVKNRQK